MTNEKQLVKVSIPQEVIDYAKEVNLPYVTHKGVAQIGGAKLRCAVLSNGQRIFTEHSMTIAMLGTMPGRSKRAKDLAALYPRFLVNKNLEPFVPQSLIDLRFHKIKYVSGAGTAHEDHGIDILVDTCNIWLAARDANALSSQEMGRAYRADMLMRALARTGVVAIVDEATGYQEKRETDALQKFLSLFLSEEKLKWAKRFPNEFYKQIFRLKGWDYNDASNKRPKIIGQITNELVYSKLAPSVLEELKRRNPVDEATRKRSYYHHQFLADIGVDALRIHLIQVITVMKMYEDNEWDKFIVDFHKHFPDPELQTLPEREVA